MSNVLSIWGIKLAENERDLEIHYSSNSFNVSIQPKFGLITLTKRKKRVFSGVKE